MRTHSLFQNNVWLFAWVIFLFFASPVSAINLLVSNNNDSGAGSLRQAISDNTTLGGSNTIVFSNVVTGTILLTSGQLFIGKSVNILGPGPSVLAINGNAASRIFDTERENNILIAGLTLTNASSPGGSGGAIFNFWSTMTVSNCTIRGNSAQNGGGIYNYGNLSNATLRVIACTLGGNSANYGGAIYNSGSSGSATVSVIGSTFTGNMASLHPVFMNGGLGGGIYNNGRSSLGAALAISNCTFSGNSAAQSGGGIYNDGEQNGMATVLVNDSIFRSNSVTLYGGGIYNDGASSSSGTASLMVNDSTFTDNSAGAGGGISSGGFDGRATNSVRGSTFNGNSAAYSGGAIAIEDPNVRFLVNASTFSANSAAERGGAIHIFNATLMVANSTFSGNFANISGDTIGIENAELDIRSTILKAGVNGVSISNNLGAVISSGYNLSSDAGGGALTNATDQINTNPLLGPLANYGGPTLTHALLPGSPAIDQGKSFGLTSDQRGIARPIDISLITNANGGDGSDIGAFEFNSPPLSIQKINNNAVLSWPTLYGSFSLESSTNLISSNSWITAGGTAFVVGSQYQQTNGPISSNRFFRLRGN